MYVYMAIIVLVCILTEMNRLLYTVSYYSNITWWVPVIVIEGYVIAKLNWISEIPFICRLYASSGLQLANSETCVCIVE